MAQAGGRRRIETQLIIAGFALVLVAAPGLVTLVAPIPVAALAAQRRWRWAAAAAVAPALLQGIRIHLWPAGGFPGWAFALGTALTAVLIGIPVGMALARGMRYSRIVVLATVLVSAVYSVVLTAQWPELNAYAQRDYEELQARLDDPDRSTASPNEEMQYRTIMFVLEHWPNVIIGSFFAGVLVSVCVVLSATLGWLVRRGEFLAPPGSFRTMRPPDALVWAVIAVALLWFAEQRWPSETLQMVVWNSAIGLGGIYGLNGLAVVLYSIDVWRPHPLLLLALVMAAVFLNMQALLPLVGLFDTWGEFRKRIDTVQAAREARENHPEDPM